MIMSSTSCSWRHRTPITGTATTLQLIVDNDPTTGGYQCYETFKWEHFWYLWFERPSSFLKLPPYGKREMHIIIIIIMITLLLLWCDQKQNACFNAERFCTKLVILILSKIFLRWSILFLIASWQSIFLDVYVCPWKVKHWAHFTCFTADATVGRTVKPHLTGLVIVILAVMFVI